MARAATACLSAPPRVKRNWPLSATNSKPSRGTTSPSRLWRCLERTETTARRVDAGFRIALTRSTAPDEEWASILATAGATSAFNERHEQINGANAIDFLLRDRDNPSSVLSSIESARSNAR